MILRAQFDRDYEPNDYDLAAGPGAAAREWVMRVRRAQQRARQQGQARSGSGGRGAYAAMLCGARGS